MSRLELVEGRGRQPHVANPESQVANGRLSRRGASTEVDSRAYEERLKSQEQARLLEGLIEHALSLSGPDETLSVFPNALKVGETLSIRHKAGRVLQVEITKNPPIKA